MTQAGLSVSLRPPHPLINHKPHATVESHSGRGRNGFDLHHIQMEAVVQRDDFTLHAWGDKSGLAFDLDGLILPDDDVADMEVEG